MKKIKKQTGYLVIVPVLLMTIGIALLTGLYFFNDSLTEDYYRWIIIAVAVLAYIVAIVLLITRRKKLNKDIISDSKIISEELKSLLEENLRISEHALSTKEFAKLQDDVNDVVKRLGQKIFFEPDNSENSIPNEIDAKTGLLTSECFQKKVVASLSKRQLFRSAVLAIKSKEAMPKEVLNKLIDKMHEVFSVKYTSSDNDIIYVYVENVSSIAVLKGECNRIITDFHELVTLPSSNFAKIYSLQIGVAVYPYSEADELIEDAKKALSATTKNLHIVANVEKPFSFTRLTLSSENQKERANTLLIENMLARLQNSDSNISGKQMIKDMLKEMSQVIDVSVAGFMLFNQTRDLMQCSFEHNLNADGLAGFKKIENLDNAFNDEYFPLFDNDGSLYCHDTRDLPNKIRNKFDNLGIKSFYHYKVVRNGKVEGLVYFNSIRENFMLTILERNALVLFTSIVAQIIGSFVANVNEERQNMILNTILKREEKYVYIVDRDTHKIIFTSKNLADKFPELQVGATCHQALNGERGPCVNCPITSGTGPVANSPLGKNLKISTINYLTSNRVEAAILIEKPAETRKEIDTRELDPVIHIPNVIALQHHFGDEILAKSQGYIGLIQINNYSGLTKTFSQSSMNEALDILSKRIQSLGYEDCIYRRDDSTIALILKQYKRPEALETMERLYATLSKPITFEGKDHVFDFHSSLITYPSDIPSRETLMKLTDTAIKEASALGINQLYIFGEKGGRLSDRKAYVLDFVKTAIREEKFEVYVQPIMDKTGKNVVSAEALLRLNDPSRGFIPPNEFVPIAAENGLMFEIEQANIRRVGDLWKLYGFSIFKQSGLKQITINISTDSLFNKDFVERVKAECRKYRFPKGFLQFEIRESILKPNLEHVKKIIASLDDQNISWSIDNYGMHETDMSEISKINVDMIKLDRTFILDLESNARGKVTASFMVENAKKLGLKICAEGVERPEQLAEVQTLPFDFIQGYLLAKPMPVNDFIRYLNFGR